MNANTIIRFNHKFSKKGILGNIIANETKAHILRTKEGKYIMYVPAKRSDDSNFPFKGGKSTPIEVSFENGKNELRI